MYVPVKAHKRQDYINYRSDIDCIIKQTKKKISELNLQIADLKADITILRELKSITLEEFVDYDDRGVLDKMLEDMGYGSET